MSVSPYPTEPLTLLSITDSHGVLSDWDYVSDAPYPSPRGLDRVATFVQGVRASTRNVLVFDAGDSIQGTPLMSLAAREPADPHPVANMLNLIGVDAACVGNHELDYGLDHFAAYAQQCSFPLLAANFTGLPSVASSTLIDLPTRALGVVRVGVLGVSTPGSLVWNASRLDSVVNAVGVVESAAVEVPRLRDAGADLVIVLSHSGLGPSTTYGSALPWPEDDTLRLMREVPGIDAVVLGHAHVEAAGHQTCEISGARVPYVEPGSLAGHVGRIDLTLSRRNGAIQVIESSALSVPMTSITPDERLTTAVEPARARVNAHLRRRIADIAEPISARPIALGPSAALDLVNHAQAAAVEDALRDTDLAGIPVLSLTAIGAPHDGFVAGPVTIRDLHRIYRFDNHLHAVVMTASEILCYLEHNARYFGPKDVPAYNLDSMGAATHAVSYCMDPTARVGSRVTDLRIDHTPPRASDRFVMAMSDYRASGGGGFPATSGNRAMYVGPPIRDLLADWMAHHSPVTLANIMRTQWSIRRRQHEE